jgi:hypothetical protein
VGCRASRRRCGLAPARPPARDSPSQAAREHRGCSGHRSSVPAALPTPAGRSAHARRTRGQWTRQGAAERRTRRSAPRRGPATARRRLGRPAAAPRRTQTTDSISPGPEGSDRLRHRRSDRTLCGGRRAADPAGCPCCSGSAHTTDARLRRQVPSPTRRLPLGARGTRSWSSPRSPSTRSCRRPAHPAGPAHGFDGRERPLVTDPAFRSHCADQSGRTLDSCLAPQSPAPVLDTLSMRLALAA